MINLISNYLIINVSPPQIGVYPKKVRRISSSCLVTMMSSTDSILVFLHRQLRYNFWRYSVPF